MPDTLLLDTLTWDLVVDINGNIARAGEPYAQAQDAASAIKLFESELWYNVIPGTPYWTQILGTSPPPLSLMKAKFEAAALTVPGVVKTKCLITTFTDRVIGGQVQVLNAAGQTSQATF
jgi:hypothetical protein